MKNEEKINKRINVTSTGCWVWLGKVEKAGQPFHYLSNHKFCHIRRYFFKEYISPSYHLSPKCDNPLCVNPEHMKIVSNMNGRECNFKIGIAGAREIRKRWALNLMHKTSLTTLAKEYKVTVEFIRQIVNNVCYKEQTYDK